MSEKLFISMYHYTRDLKHSRYPEIKGLDVLLFHEQLQFFKDNCNVVTMEQVIETVKGRDSLPERAVLLTFDDGYFELDAIRKTLINIDIVNTSEMFGPWIEVYDISEFSLAES